MWWVDVLTIFDGTLTDKSRLGAQNYTLVDILPAFGCAVEDIWKVLVQNLTFGRFLEGARSDWPTRGKPRVQNLAHGINLDEKFQRSGLRLVEAWMSDRSSKNM